MDERVATLADRASRHRRQFTSIEDPPDEERALRYLREGVGEVVAVYIDARTGAGPPTVIAPDSFDRLENALNEWLELYAACYGRDIDAAFTVREAAEVLIATHDLQDVARLLTKIPPRDRGNKG